jgi:prepilin signal peptidase PulO-like enzyme (type II secretory pathway)
MAEVLTAPEVPLESLPPGEPAARRRPTRELLPSGASRGLVVVISVALVAASFVSFGATGWGVLGAVFCPVLVLLGAIDLEHHLLPNDIVLPAALAIAVIILIEDAGAFLPHLVAALALALFFLTFALLFRGGLGMGDVKLGFVVGLALGLSTLPAMFLAFTGLFVSAVWVLVKDGLSARKRALPFGPFIAIGSIVAYFLS